MLCDICNKKKATVHLTEIVDDQMSEMHLCEECARQKSVQMEQQFGLADLLAGLADFGKPAKEETHQTVKCPNCGMNYDEFRKFGRLGCSDCYDAFKMQLSTLLKKVHGASHHVGKSPAKISQSEKAKIENFQELKAELQQAIQMEDFELAAEIRDKIRDLENKKKTE